MKKILFTGFLFFIAWHNYAQQLNHIEQDQVNSNDSLYKCLPGFQRVDTLAIRMFILRIIVEKNSRSFECKVDSIAPVINSGAMFFGIPAGNGFPYLLTNGLYKWEIAFKGFLIPY